LNRIYVAGEGSTRGWFIVVWLDCRWCAAVAHAACRGWLSQGV
jgi:hypothetical protein